jgi:hypothetical protein
MDRRGGVTSLGERAQRLEARYGLAGRVSRAQAFDEASALPIAAALGVYHSV